MKTVVMKPLILLSATLLLGFGAAVASGAEGTNSPYTDAAGDIDPGISNANGTLDILGMEVTNTATDIIFTLTLNGDISSTDWGKFMIGFSTGSTATTNTGNGWGRPIELNSPLGGMDYWIGAWVDGGCGAQLWDFDGATWNGPIASTSHYFAAGATSA